MGENEMRAMADALWNYFLERHLRSYLSDSVCYFLATVTAAPSGGEIEVQRPFDNPVIVRCAWSAETLQVGDSCVVLMLGDMSNAIAIGDGTLGEPGIYVTKAGLLGSTGAATDNTMTQAAITAALNGKADPSDIPDASDADPQMDGTASAGSSADYARGDHVHPHDSSKQDAMHFYTYTFSASAWTGSGSSYSLTLSAATHGCGTDPFVTVLRQNGTAYEQDFGYPSAGLKISIAANGNITLTTGAAFAGKIKVFSN